MDVFDEFGNCHQVHSLFHDSDPNSIADEVDYAAYHTLLVHHYPQPEFLDGELYFGLAHEQNDTVGELAPSDGPKPPPDDSSSNKKAPQKVTTREPNFDLLCPLFGWMKSTIIAKTFEKTTQYGRIPISTILKKHYKASNPALNVHRHDEDVATDSFFSDTPAVDSGAMCAQLYVGCSSQVTDAFGCKTDGEFVNTLEDNIRKHGAPNHLLSDRAQAKVSNKVKQVLRGYCIGDWQSEPWGTGGIQTESALQFISLLTSTHLSVSVRHVQRQQRGWKFLLSSPEHTCEKNNTHEATTIMAIDSSTLYNTTRHNTTISSTTQYNSLACLATFCIHLATKMSLNNRTAVLSWMVVVVYSCSCASMLTSSSAFVIPTMSSSLSSRSSSSSSTMRLYDAPIISPFDDSSSAGGDGNSSSGVVSTYTPTTPVESDEELLDLTMENVEMVLDEMRPYLIQDGGNVAITEIDGPVVRLELQVGSHRLCVCDLSCLSPWSDFPKVQCFGWR